MGLKGSVCSYFKKGRGKRGLRVSGQLALQLPCAGLCGACETNVLQGGGGGCGSAPSPFCSQLSWGRSSGEQEIPVGVSLFWAVAEPILTLRAAKVLPHSWVQPQVMALFLRGSFLRKLQAAIPSVLLLFTLKVNRFISFVLQLRANNVGYSMYQTGKR